MWHGPNFLVKANSYPSSPEIINDKDIPEQRKIVQTIHFVTQSENYVLERFSNYKRLLRFTVYAMRWYKQTKNRSSLIRAHEIRSAENQWIKIVQTEMFGRDIHSISQNGWSHTPTIRQFNPFVDENGILRMNGRVGNADLLEQKTAIIIPAQHHFTTLMIRDAHDEVMHGGVQLTLRKLREKFWIIHARRQVQKTIHKCVRCFRFRKQFMQQKMADLPKFRTEQARPFAFVGCDYAGPFEIKVSTRRNSPTTKGYIALFICLTTKALHLELVADLSSAEFIMAFENFIARRGIPVMLYTMAPILLAGPTKFKGSMSNYLLKTTHGLNCWRLKTFNSNAYQPEQATWQEYGKEPLALLNIIFVAHLRIRNSTLDISIMY